MLPLMRAKFAACQASRTTRDAPVNWRFATDDSRIKLTRRYPKH